MNERERPWRWLMAAARKIASIGCALALCACGGKSASGSKSAVMAAADAGEAPVRALYAPSAKPRFGDVPWPDDGYLDANGRVGVRDLSSQAPSEYAAALASAMGDLDGFGLRPTIYFRFDGALDPSSWPSDPQSSVDAHASVFLVDADTSSPEAFKRVPIEIRYDAAAFELRLRPAAVHALNPGRRYAAVVTRAVSSADGRPIDGALRFLRVRDPETALADPRERAARASYAPVLETLATHGLARDRVAALAVFHVQSLRTDLADARDLVRKAPAPTPDLTDALSGARLDAALGSPRTGAVGLDARGPHEHIGWMVQGSFSSPGLLASRAAVHGAFERNAAGELRAKRQDDVFFTLFLPRGSPAGPAWPVVIVQHGLGRERSDALPLANALAASGFAVIAIDAPFHGLRSGGGDLMNRFTGETSPDGFGDSPGDFAGQNDDAGDLQKLHPFYYRDAVRQGVVDLAGLAYLLQSGDWSGLAKLDATLSGLKLDSAGLPFVGIDLGGEMGVMLSSLEPSMTSLVLAFSGGLTVDGWLDSPGAKPLVDALLSKLGRDPDLVDWSRDSPSLWPDLDAWRTLTDRASALAYAPSVRRLPINVLMLMARDDEVVHNRSTEMLADALGAVLVGGRPQYVETLSTDSIRAGAALSANFMAEGGAVTRVLYLLDSATHDTLTLARGKRSYASPLMAPFVPLDNPVSVDNPIAQTMTQVAFFFQSQRACGMAMPSSNSKVMCAASVQAPASP